MNTDQLVRRTQRELQIAVLRGTGEEFVIHDKLTNEYLADTGRFFYADPRSGRWALNSSKAKLFSLEG